jgi:hypothetical protein
MREKSNMQARTASEKLDAIVSLTPCFSGVLAMAGDRKTVLTVFRESEGFRK